MHARSVLSVIALTTLIAGLPFAAGCKTSAEASVTEESVEAAPVALELGAGFVPIRKPGKLPYETIREDYSLEYGFDALEVHVDALEAGQRVLLVDDVIATGGTAAAAIKLLKGIGAEVVGFSVFIELVFLSGNELLDGVPIHALVRYD